MPAADSTGPGDAGDEPELADDPAEAFEDDPPPPFSDPPSEAIDEEPGPDLIL